MATMKAVRIHAYGGPEVLHHEENIPLPTLEPEDILIRVRAAAVNPVDWKIREGYLQGALRHTLPLILGWDVSGEVVEVDPAVTEFKVRDEVYARPDIERDGGYAEYIAVKASDAAHKPTRLDHLHAAAVPLAALTAWQSLVDAAQLQAGQTVLIHAAAGGVGSLAVQIAKASGARVLGTCRAANQPMVRSLGADVVIDYRTEDFVEAALRETEGRGVDAVYDTVGGDTLARSIQAVRPHGKLASIVDTSGDLNGAYGKNLRLYFGFMERSGEKMEILRVLAERRQLRPVIDSLMPLNQVANAHRRLEAGGVSGKIVLQIHP